MHLIWKIAVLGSLGTLLLSTLVSAGAASAFPQSGCGCEASPGFVINPACACTAAVSFMDVQDGACDCVDGECVLNANATDCSVQVSVDFSIGGAGCFSPSPFMLQAHCGGRATRTVPCGGAETFYVKLECGSCEGESCD